MSALATDGLLALMVLLVWLACAGFLRLPSALDRLHVATFVYAGAGPALLLAALVSDGFSSRVLKIAVWLVWSLIGGGASVHAVARALALRGSVPQAELVDKLRRGERA